MARIRGTASSGWGIVRRQAGAMDGIEAKSSCEHVEAIMWIKHKSRQSILSSVILFLLITSTIGGSAVYAQGTGGLKRQVNPQTGRLSFLLPEAGNVLLAREALNDMPVADRRADPAMALARRFGAEFGLRDPERE